ncbi:PH domain-containing protein [Halopolyspora algeriensis]|uniref:PH domain-containing protein n=1 Tax=Halopolyspora algeriensis TaxID=1500506 RepID=UPI000DF423EE|nr:PH domain-containing protein [Halopolyspora algeriensis]
MTSHAGIPRQWSPPAALVTCGWVLTAAAVLWWLSSSDPIDRLFTGTLVLALAAVSAYGSLVRPRLAADADGITVRSLGGTHRWTWQQVEVRVHRTPRLGRTVDVLELDVPEQHRPGGLIVLTKLDLGTDVGDVAEQLEHLRP